MKKTNRTFLLAGAALVTSLVAGAVVAQESVELTEEKIASTSMMALSAYRSEDYDTAYRLFEALEPQGNGFVLFQLGFMDMVGEGTDRNLQRSVERYKKACDAGFGPACTAVEGLTARETSEEDDPWKAVRRYD